MIPIRSGRMPTSGAGAFGAHRSTHAHNGIDISARKGTRVVAARAGVVEHASNVWRKGFTGYGRYVVIRHASGIRTLYAHMGFVGVKVGAKVKEGQQIGTVGNSLFKVPPQYTDESGGPHLHFEVSARAYPQSNQNPRLDPIAWLDDSAPMITVTDPKRRGPEVSPGAPISGAIALLLLLAATRS